MDEQEEARFNAKIDALLEDAKKRVHEGFELKLNEKYADMVAALAAQTVMNLEFLSMSLIEQAGNAILIAFLAGYSFGVEETEKNNE